MESVLLAIGGGIAGLVVAMGAARLLLSLAFSVSTFLPISTRPSPLVLAFAFGVAVITVPWWLKLVRDLGAVDRRIFELVDAQLVEFSGLPATA